MRSQTTLIMIIAAVAVVGVVAIGWAMMRSNQASTITPAPEVMMEDTTTLPAETTTEAEPDVPADDTVMMDGDVKVFEVEAGSFYYKPNVIRVKQGDTVRIVMKSVSMMHDFNIDELSVKIPVTPDGNTAEVEFTADKVGEFEYYCSVGQHRQNGQVGTLIVE